MQTEIFVLIVGGGPVGLSAAIELQWRDVPTVLVTENLDTTQHPKCNSTNVRSMEHFRRLGLSEELRSEVLPTDLERASAYVTRFCGYEFGRLPRPAATVWPSSENVRNGSQIKLEKILRAVAERPAGSEIHFGWKLISFEALDDGVIADIESATTQERRQIRARYLLGIDGASSTVRRALGFRMVGEDGSAPRAFMGGTMLSYYIRSPSLFAASGRKPVHMTWIINADIRAMWYSQDGRETWVVHYQVPAGIDWRGVDMRVVLRDMIGADVPFEVISGGPWTGGLALVSERYQQGPVFLAGDAAHLFTPLGGLGMNTGIGDVMNLGWKLAAHYEGWAGPNLLDSYEIERRPMGVRNSRLGVHCTGIMNNWDLPPNLEDAGPEADAARTAFGARVVEEDRIQYMSIGLQLGERYEDSPIVRRDETPSPPDQWDRYVPHVRGGARAPHYWLADKHALFDDFGRGFTLLDFGAPGEAAKLREAADTRRLPLAVLPLKPPPDGPYRSKLVLVRPDQHIAWHGDAAAEPFAVIDKARGA